MKFELDISRLTGHNPLKLSFKDFKHDLDNEEPTETTFIYLMTTGE